MPDLLLLLLFAALGFGLGALACVAADAVELRKKRQPIRIFVAPFADCSPRARREAAQAAVDALFQDSTLPTKDS